MNYKKAVEYFYSLGNEVKSMKLGLENITMLLEALGRPQDKFTKIQIAGTNGKGSTAVFIETICRCASIKTGLFTSPHLIDFTERIKINGEDISKEEFAHFTSIVRGKVEELVDAAELPYIPTFFEQMTAVGLVAFAEKGVELAILETGIGGRLDAVTAADAEFAVLTRISIDHQEYLGDTVEMIAAEKAAIIRPGCKAVSSPQSAEVASIIIDRANRAGVDVNWATKNIKTEPRGKRSPELAATFITKKAKYGGIVPGLKGRHQIENAATAIAAAEMLQKSGSDISIDNIKKGLETARHPGRLEYVNGFLLDGAHNVAGAEVLSSYIQEFYKEPVVMIFGMMTDKEISEVINILASNADTLIITKPDNLRAAEPVDIANAVNDKTKTIILTKTVKEAIDTARQIADGKDNIIVGGSLYLVGEVKKILNNSN